MVNDILAGEYHSVFKGQGMEFEEVREYVPGDDIRLIDWNVTARTSVPHIKKLVEERELTVMLMRAGRVDSAAWNASRMNWPPSYALCWRSPRSRIMTV